MFLEIIIGIVFLVLIVSQIVHWMKFISISITQYRKRMALSNKIMELSQMMSKRKSPKDKNDKENVGYT